MPRWRLAAPLAGNRLAPPPGDGNARRDSLAGHGRPAILPADEEILLDLDKLEPLIAQPSSPDNVVPVREIEGIPVDQVCIGACTNSTFRDLSVAAEILQGLAVQPKVDLIVLPGSRQIQELAAAATGSPATCPFRSAARAAAHPASSSFFTWRSKGFVSW